MPKSITLTGHQLTYCSAEGITGHWQLWPETYAKIIQELDFFNQRMTSKQGLIVYSNVIPGPESLKILELILKTKMTAWQQELVDLETSYINANVQGRTKKHAAMPFEL